jgi:hypothetical protein
MFRLCADSESSVQSAVQFLDNLVKDIVTASNHFNVDAFIPKLRDYLRVINPHKRQFLISWITGGAGGGGGGKLLAAGDLSALRHLVLLACHGLTVEADTRASMPAGLPTSVCYQRPCMPGATW